MSKITLVAILAIALIVGCSNDDGTKPPTETAFIRLLNIAHDDTIGLDLSVVDRKVTSGVKSGKSSGYVLAGASGDAIKVGIHFAGKDSARVSSVQRMYTGGSFTAYAFPPIKTFSFSFDDDVRRPMAGKACINLVNGISDGGQLSLAYTDDSLLLGPLRYTVVSDYSDIDAGTYPFSVLQLGNSTFEIAYDSVRLDQNTSYTLALMGTLTDADSWGVIARLYNNNVGGSTYQDLRVSTDRGSIQVVHAVPGAGPISVNLDGSATASINNLAFSNQSPYIDLAPGQHTATVLASGSPVITDATFLVAQRGLKTLFGSGRLFPPNVVLLELVDLKKPLVPNETSVRVVHLSADAPNLDGYVVTPTGDLKIDECQDLSFRKASYSDTFTSAFFSRVPSTYTIVFKKAGTNQVVVGPTTIVLKAGKIITLWIGGLSASAKLYTVTHN